MTPQELAEIKNRPIDSMSADAPHNPDIWTLAADRDALIAEVERLNRVQQRKTAAIGRALDGLPPAPSGACASDCPCRGGVL